MSNPTNLNGSLLGVSMACRNVRLAVSLIVFLVLPLFISISSPVMAQVAHSEQVQIAPPLVRAIDPPAPDATSSALEQQADLLRAQKLFLDAMDYYHAALSKAAKDNAESQKQIESRLLNKIGITELLLQRYKEARKSFERSIHIDKRYADAYNNLGVIFYEGKKYGPAVKQYEKAIAMDHDSASFFNNLGAAYFSKKDFDKALAAYQHAMELDPEVFARSSRTGVQAQLPSPEDHARYDYTVARLYAKMGFSDESLEYLRKAMEEGYKEIKSVYKDVEFAELRKSPRFAQLMTATSPALAN